MSKIILETKNEDDNLKLFSMVHNIIRNSKWKESITIGRED